MKDQPRGRDEDSQNSSNAVVDPVGSGKGQEYDLSREEKAEEGDDHSGPGEEGDKTRGSHPQAILRQLQGAVEIILVVRVVHFGVAEKQLAPLSLRLRQDRSG